MPYKVTAPEVGVLKALSEHKDEDGKVIGYDHETVLRFQGEIVADEDVSPVVKELYADGDPHTCSVLEYVESDEVDEEPEEVEEEEPAEEPEEEEPEAPESGEGEEPEEEEPEEGEGDPQPKPLGQA